MGHEKISVEFDQNAGPSNDLDAMIEKNVTKIARDLLMINASRV